MTFWTSVVNNLAGIIVAITGFGAMIGGFIMQYRMMKHQNHKIDSNAARAVTEREVMSAKIEEVHSATNGLVERNVAIAKSLGMAEGMAAGLEQGRNEPPV